MANGSHGLILNSENTLRVTRTNSLDTTNSLRIPAADFEIIRELVAGSQTAAADSADLTNNGRGKSNSGLL